MLVFEAGVVLEERREWCGLLNLNNISETQRGIFLSLKSKESAHSEYRKKLRPLASLHSQEHKESLLRFARKYTTLCALWSFVNFVTSVRFN